MCRIAYLTTLLSLAMACEDPPSVPTRRVGDVLWRVDHGFSDGRQWSGIPAVSGNQVFFDVERDIRSYDTGTGQLLWSANIRSEPYPGVQSIHVQNGLVVAADGGAVIALEERAGTLRWKAAPNDSLIQSYGAADARAYYTGTRGGFVFALELSSGATLWQSNMQVGTDWFAANIIGLAVSGDTLFVTGIFRRDRSTLKPQGFVAALDRRDGRRMWKYETPNLQNGVGFYGGPAVTSNFVLQGDVLQRRMLALDRYTGELRWYVETDPNWGGPPATPFIENDVAYFGTHGGTAYAVNITTGRVKWKTETGSGIEDVVVCGNHVFTKSQGSDILNKHTGARVRLVVAESNDFLTSALVTSGKRVFGTGIEAAYALSC